MSHPHKQLEPVKYEAISARELLTEMKTISELMIDLAYSALLFSDKELGHWVLELESEVDRLGYQLFMTLSMSVRGKEDAELSLGLFRVCVAANRISDAAADMASLAVTGQEAHPSIRSAFLRVEERLMTGRVAEESKINGLSIGEVYGNYDIGVDVTAVRRNGSWTINPASDFVMGSGDVIFARGTEEVISRLVELVTGRPQEEQHVEGEERYAEIARILLEMKETSEFMVSLAYAAVRYDERDLAEEVLELEDRIDRLHEIVGKETLSLKDDVLQGWTLIRIANSIEAIADAAWEMAMVPLSGLDTHPIIRAIADEAEEIVSRIEVMKGSLLTSHTLAELELKHRYGIYVQSIKRSGHWFHRPSGRFCLQPGDLLIVDGYRAGFNEIRKELEPSQED